MKVLHVLHYSRGGIVTVVMTQIRQSANAAIEYHLAVVESGVELQEQARIHGIKLHVLGANPLRLLWRYWQLLRGIRPDIVHTHSYVPRMLTGLATLCRVGRFRRVSTMHNDYPYFYAPDRRSRFKRGSEACMLRAFNQLTICGSEKVRREVQRGYRIAPDRLKRIHNGICIAALPTADAVREAAAEQIVVTVGRVSEQKNYGMLLDCWAEVAKTHPRARLWIIGDGEQRESLRMKAKALGIDATVQFWGWKSPAEVFDILRRAAVFVLSSLHESLPTAMLEAYSAELPVISTRVAGVEEVIEQDVSGYIVDDAPGMVRALRSMLAMPAAQRIAMGRRGRQKVVAEFSAQRYVLEVERAYLETAA